MAAFMGGLITATVDRLARWIVIPITSLIPILVARGVLFAGFAVLWVAFGAALIADQGAPERVWEAIARLPLPLQGLAWLLFLPLMAGLWVWGTDWPLPVRLLVVGGIAAWNLLVFVPRRTAGPHASAAS
jgi:hypothetical protein